MLHSSSAAHSGGSAHAAAPAALPQPGGPAVRLLCPAAAPAPAPTRGAGPSSDQTLDLAVVGSLAVELLGGGLLGALRAQALALGQVRRAIAAKLGTAESRLKGNSAIKALLKQKMIDAACEAGVWAYSVVACCCVCMHMAVFGDTFGEVMLGLSPHNKQY